MVSDLYERTHRNRSSRWLALALVGVLGGCAGGLDIPGLGGEKDTGFSSPNEPVVRSDTLAKSLHGAGMPQKNYANREAAPPPSSERLRSNVQIASADVTNSGIFHKSYKRHVVDPADGNQSLTGSPGRPALRHQVAALPDRSVGTEGGDARSWWEVLKASDRLDAERDRISLRQIAQDTAKPGAQSGEIDLASANQEFANPLTSATMVIIENDTVLLDGDLASGTETTNITVFEPIIPVSLGDTG